MKLSIHKSTKSEIIPYNNKISNTINSREFSFNKSKKLNNTDNQYLKINNYSKKKKLISLKSDITKNQPQSLFLQFRSSRLNSNNNNNSKYVSTTTTFTEIKPNNKNSFRTRNQKSNIDQILIKPSLNEQIRPKSTEKIYDNNRRSSMTLAFFISKENQINKQKKENKNKLNFKKINYPLNELMKLDPYHYLSNDIKDNITKFKKINKKYIYPNLGRTIKTPRGNSLKALDSNSILLRKADKRILLLKKLLKIYKNSYEELKYIVKWEGINHLWQIHTKSISHILKCFPVYKWFLDENELMNYDKLIEFLKISFQTVTFNDNIKCFIEDIYDLFSQNKIHINIKKVFCTFVITDNTILYNDKIDFLFNIWGDANNDIIDLKSVFYYIKGNLIYKNDYQKIISFFKQVQPKIYIIEKETLYNYFIKNQKLRNIFEKNCDINYKKVEEQYNDVITTYFMSNIRGFNFSVNHHRVKSFCPIDTNKLEKILENIDKCNEIKQNANELFKENIIFY